VDFISNFLDTVKALVINPKTFFDQIDWDSGWKEPIIFFAVCSTVYALGSAICISATVNSTLSYLRSVGADTSGFPPSSFAFGTIFLFSFASSLIGSQIFSFATAFSLHLMGGTGTLQRTYLALACCWVVMLVVWIPFIGWIPGLYFFYLAYLGLAKAHSVPGWKALLGILLGSISVAVCSFALAALVGLAILKPPIDPDDNLPKDPEVRRLMQDYERKE